MTQSRYFETPTNSGYYDAGSTSVYEFIQDRNLNFARGNVIKYVARAGIKNFDTELEDLKKAQWYLEQEIQRIEVEIETGVREWPGDDGILEDDVDDGEIKDATEIIDTYIAGLIAKNLPRQG